MIHSGWIKLHRRLIEWEWYTDSHTVHLFIHCIIKANHQDKKWQGMTIKRGQFVTSFESLKKETGISLQTLRTCLSRLEQTQELTRKPTNKNTIITVLNYETYQDAENETNTQTNKQTTNNQQTTNKQPTTTNNEENYKNENNDNKLGELSARESENKLPTFEEIKTIGEMLMIPKDITKLYFYSRDADDWLNKHGRVITNIHSDMKKFQASFNITAQQQQQQKQQTDNSDRVLSTDEMREYIQQEFRKEGLI